MLKTGIIQYGTEDLLGGAVDSVLNMVFQLAVTLVQAIETIFNDVFNGILQNAILSNSSIMNLYKTFLGLFFIIVPLKIIYEIIKGQATDDDRFDAKKRIINAVWATAMAVSIPVLLTFATNVQREAVSLIVSGSTTSSFNYGRSDTSQEVKANKQVKSYSKDVVSSVFTSLGGMDEKDKYHTAEAMYYRIITNGGYIYINDDGKPEALPLEHIAKNKDDSEGWYEAVSTSLLKSNGKVDESVKSEVQSKAVKNVVGDTVYKEPGGFYAYRRYSDDTEGNTAEDFVEEGDQYAVSTTPFQDKVKIVDRAGKETTLVGKPHVWRFNIWGITVGVIIVAVMMFTFLFQVAMRTMLLAFYKVIAPLCCISLISEDSTAFSVWRQSTISNLLTTVAQVFMLSFTISAVESLNSSLNGQFPLAQIAFFIGGLSATITIPSFISAMVGGYSAGVMAGMQQAQSVVAGAKGALLGAIGLGASAAGAGKNILFGKGSTEYQGQGPSSSGKPGGQGDGHSDSGDVATIKRTKGGLVGSLLGDKVKKFDKDNNLLSSERDKTTGLTGSAMRRINGGISRMQNSNLDPVKDIGNKFRGGLNKASDAKSKMENVSRGISNRATDGVNKAYKGALNVMKTPLSKQQTLSQKGSIRK